MSNNAMDRKQEYDNRLALLSVLNNGADLERIRLLAKDPRYFDTARRSLLGRFKVADLRAIFGRGMLGPMLAELASMDAEFPDSPVNGVDRLLKEISERQDVSSSAKQVLERAMRHNAIN